MNYGALKRDSKSRKEYSLILKMKALLAELGQNRQNGDIFYFSRDYPGFRRYARKENDVSILMTDYVFAAKFLSTLYRKQSPPAIGTRFINDNRMKIFIKHLEQLKKISTVICRSKEKLQNFGEKVENLIKTKLPTESTKICPICLATYDNENKQHFCLSSCGHLFYTPCFNILETLRRPIRKKNLTKRNSIKPYLETHF